MTSHVHVLMYTTTSLALLVLVVFNVSDVPTDDKLHVKLYQNSLDSTGRSRLGPELVWKGPESVRRDQNLSGGTRIRLWGQNGDKNQEKWTLNTTKTI